MAQSSGLCAGLGQRRKGLLNQAEKTGTALLMNQQSGTCFFKGEDSQASLEDY